MATENDDVEFFRRQEVVEEGQEGLAPVIDIFTRKKLNARITILPVSTSETEEQKNARLAYEEFWNDSCWKKSR